MRIPGIFRKRETDTSQTDFAGGAVAANPDDCRDRLYLRNIRSLLRSSSVLTFAAGCAAFEAFECAMTSSVPGTFGFAFFGLCAIWLVYGADSRTTKVELFCEFDRMHRRRISDDCCHVVKQCTAIVDDCKAAIQAERDFCNQIFGMNGSGGAEADGWYQDLSQPSAEIIPLNTNWRQ